ncbi:uncharacterized protein LOC131936734 [Physella acuta]|uniref:uncharacterized protein LOC131936734 n=1 Tax=Physella acuta TaxID=109671 RepID=UPI0027DD8019|nr:uncharacterized protein LOC131936734 [Physella acuta]
MDNPTSALNHVENHILKPQIPSRFPDVHPCLESTTIYWGVFWDIENVQVGIDRTNFMIEKVKEFVKSKQDGRYVHKDPLFVCAADFKNQKDSLVKVLQEAKVELHHVLKGKDSADNEIIESFDKFNSWPPQTAVVIITSDKRLMEKIKNRVADLKFKCDLFLIYKQESIELKQYVHKDKRISFDELMQLSGTNKRYFQKFFELLKSYWKHICDVKQQKICFKAPENGQQIWFKSIKGGEVVFYLNSDQKKNVKMNFTVSKSTTAQEMRSSLTFATLILVYNNHLLKNLQQKTYHTPAPSRHHFSRLL